MKNNLFCIGPAPLLWKGLFLFVPLLFVAMLGLLGHIGLLVYQNKKKRKRKILDCSIKKDILWLLVVVFSLITYGVIGLNFEFYLLEFFIVAVFVQIALFAGEHCKLFKVHHSRIIATAIVALVFALLFATCWISNVREKRISGSEENVRCTNGTLF